MRAYLILLIALVANSCNNNSGTKSLNQSTPTSSDFQKAESLFNSDIKKDSAFYYFTNVTKTSDDSLLVAMAYTYMAMIQEDAGDFFGCQESALEGLQHLNDKNPQHYSCLASIYNEIGISHAGLKNYDAAIDYYNLATKFQKKEAYKTIFQNNIAVAYREKGDYQKAIQILEPVLEKQRNNQLEYARALTNLASLKWRINTHFDPIPDLMYALTVRKNEKDGIGTAASYHQLSDYYLSRNTDSAFFYAEKMYRLAQEINSTDKELDALQKLVTLASPTQSKIYFKRYQFLNDSLIVARNAAKNQFALIRYQSEKNKTENLQLQQENSAKQLKILQQGVWIYGISALVLIVIIVAWWWLRKKRQQIRLQSQVTIREHHLKISQKVHDIVANGLYHIMNEIEHKPGIEKETLLNKIDQLYERSRDISYEPVDYPSGTEEIINELLSSFATAETKVSMVGNKKEIWEQIPSKSAKELELVLKELMVNMSKHSQAQYVVVRFNLSDHSLVITYRDNGVGFETGFQLGNGLKSTETRIRGIGGDLIFTTEPGQGASIKIVIPI